MYLLRFKNMFSVLRKYFYVDQLDWLSLFKTNKDITSIH